MSRLIVKGQPLATLQKAIDRAELISETLTHSQQGSICSVKALSALSKSLHAALNTAYGEIIEQYVEVETLEVIRKECRK